MAGQKSKLVDVLLAIALGYLACCPASQGAGAPPLWGNLEAGQYDVGFRTVEEYDYSRTFLPKHDYFGELLPGERARPIQICIWYPAAPAAQQQPMVYGEYCFPNPDDGGFFDFASAVQGREINLLVGTFQGNRGYVQELMGLPMGAVRDAKPAAGVFPLIVYHPSPFAAYCDNATLCEYLASHGYVVATTHPLPQSGFSYVNSGANLQALVRDREYVFGRMRSEPQVDLNRVGLLGRGIGGSSALLMQMRNSDVDAVACLDGAFAYRDQLELLRQQPHYDSGKVRAPLLQTFRADDSSASLSLVSSLTYCDRHSLACRGITANEFSHYGPLLRLGLSERGEYTVDSVGSYPALCRYTLRFFDAHLKADAQAKGFLTNSLGKGKIRDLTADAGFTPAAKPPPDEQQFISIIRERGVDQALEVFERFKDLAREQPFIREAVINVIGYEFLQGGQFEEAIKLLKLNTEVFSNSCNTWDSLSDAYLANHQYDAAADCARKTLEVIETDNQTDSQFKELIRRSAEEKLERLTTEDD